jgi:hypothetical protein
MEDARDHEEAGEQVAEDPAQERFVVHRDSSR